METYNTIPIWKKINLTINEAARYSGIGRDKLYEIAKTPHCQFVLRNGSHILIKRKEFEEYMSQITEV